MQDPIQEIIDLFYYHVVVGSSRLDRDTFKPVLQDLAPDKKTEYEGLVNGLLGDGNRNSSWQVVADTMFERVNDFRDGGVLITSVIGSLVSADLRFSTKITKLFALRCFQVDRFKQAVLDILIRLALENETIDAPMLEYIVECLETIGMDEQTKENVFIALGRNLHAEAGRLILAKSKLLPQQPEKIFSVFSVCGPVCTSVLIQGMSFMDDRAGLITELADIIIRQPGQFALSGLGKLYMFAADDNFGEQVKARVRASVVLVAERLEDNDITNFPASVELLVGISLSLRLDSSKTRALANTAIMGIVELLENMKVTEFEYPIFSRTVISIISQISSDQDLLHFFVTRISSIAGRLYTYLRNPETRDQARIYFRVLGLIVESQSKIGRPLPVLRAIIENYTDT